MSAALLYSCVETWLHCTGYYNYGMCMSTQCDDCQSLYLPWTKFYEAAWHGDQ